MNIFILNYISIVLYFAIYLLGSNFSGTRAYKKSIQKALFIFMAIQNVLLLGLRDSSIGVDTIRYVSAFYQLDSNLSFTRFEKGFQVLLRLINYVYINENFFLFFVATISLIPLMIIIYKYSDLPFYSYAIYVSLHYYSFLFSGLRQGVAIALILISYHFIKQKKLSMFLLCVLLATLMHFTAIIFIPAYILDNVKVNRKSITVFILAFIGVMILRESIYSLVLRFVYDDYQLVSTGAYKWTLLYVLIFIVCLFFRRRVFRKFGNSTQSLYVYVGVGIILMVFSLVGTNALRVANYYNIFIILLVPKIIGTFNVKFDRIFISIIGFIFFASIYLVLFSQGAYGIIPYKFFW